MRDLFVYMMTNKSRVVLSTGVTNDLERRVSEHKNKAVKGFTSRYHLDRLVYYEVHPIARDAIAREKEIKAWRREKKNDLVNSLNPRWDDLANTLFHCSRDSSLRYQRTWALGMSFRLGSARASRVGFGAPAETGFAPRPGMNGMQAEVGKVREGGGALASTRRRVRYPNSDDHAKSVVLAQQSIPQRGFRVSE